MESLTVSGDGAVVIVDGASQISLTSTGSTVGWAEGSPSVSDTGTANTARQLSADES